MNRTVDKELTYFRLTLNKLSMETSMLTLEDQHEILEECLAPIPFSTHVHELTLALNNQGDYRGFTSELNLLIQKDEMIRGHDYLKFWMKTLLITQMGANTIIADAASYQQLSQHITYEEKQTLLRMMRGMKRDLQGRKQ